MLSREQRAKLPDQWHHYVRQKSAAVLEWAALGLPPAEIAARLKVMGLDKPPEGCMPPERPWGGPRPARPVIRIKPAPMYKPRPAGLAELDFFAKYLNG